MRYKYIIPTLYIFSTLPLFSEENKLGDILQESGEKKALVTPVEEKKKVKKKSRFIFKDTYENKAIEAIDENRQQKESKKYVYENKPKFKFTSGSGYNNIGSGQGSSSASSGSLGGGYGTGQGRGGRR